MSRTLTADRFFAVLGTAILITLAGVGAYAHAVQDGWFGMALALIVPLGGMVSWWRARRAGGAVKNAADEMASWLGFAVMLYTFAIWPSR